MKKTLWLFALVSVTGFLFFIPGYSSATPSQDKPCDLKTVEKAKYCGQCGKFTEKNDLNDDGECNGCGMKPSEIDVCVKRYYECATCHQQMVEKKKCHEADPEEHTVQSKVVFKCTECGESSDKESACENETCGRKGKTMTKTCAKSGTFPHGGTPAEGKKEEKKENEDKDRED